MMIQPHFTISFSCVFHYQGMDVPSVSEWSMMEKSMANKAASTGRPSTYKFRLFIEGDLFEMVHLYRPIIIIKNE